MLIYNVQVMNLKSKKLSQNIKYSLKNYNSVFASTDFGFMNKKDINDKKYVQKTLNENTFFKTLLHFYHQLQWM